MDPADISQILPTIEQQKTRFVQIIPSKSKQYIESIAFHKIFYRKSTMKELLEERTALCISLGLTSCRKMNRLLNSSTIAANFCLLFKDCSSQLDEFCWTILEDRGTIYGFGASQEKFLPHCKACNYSVYLSLRANSGRIVCSNRKCRIQLLSEFELSSPKAAHKEQEKAERGLEERNSQEVAVRGGSEGQDSATLKQIEMIKKAAKRIAD